jgi:hypothetical protein
MRTPSVVTASSVESVQLDFGDFLLSALVVRLMS